jgi:hypothetical protein
VDHAIEKTPALNSWFSEKAWGTADHTLSLFLRRGLSELAQCVVRRYATDPLIGIQTRSK